MRSDITYCQENENFEWIYHDNSIQAYSLHTHASHLILGCVLKGSVSIVKKDVEYIYGPGEYFCILPDTPHAMRAEREMPYSMYSMCFRIGNLAGKPEGQEDYVYLLKRLILQMPYNADSIVEMARRVGISPYYMIRKFKHACGLSPHAFRIQCRVRMAQKLLENGKSVVETAYETGFYDQSHLDRCFRKIVGLTPEEYKSAILASTMNIK